MTSRRYVFGEFSLDLDRACLSRGGAEVGLRPKSFDALRFLVENPGRIVTKDELIGAVWPDVVVTDDSLSKCIQEVREALDDRPPRYIKTVPRRGYLFDEPVEPAPSDRGAGASAGAQTAPAGARVAAAPPPEQQPAERTARVALRSPSALGLVAVVAAAGVAAYFLLFDAAPDRSGEPPSIAVLPFLNLSSDQGQEYFSDGLAEELLNKLASLEGLRVAARTSSFAFKGSNDDITAIAASLGVGNVLEGSVRRDGNSIRVTAQLVEGTGGTQRWSKTYERELDSIFAIQEDIAGSIAAELSLTLGIAEREALRSGTDSVEAFDHYLAGTALLNEFGADSTAQGLERVERATEIDPDYAEAWAVLAIGYIQHAYFVTRDFDRAATLAERAARRALDLNPNLAPARSALGNVNLLRGDWAGAEQEIRAAVAIPSDFTPLWDYAEFLQAAGYLEEALDYRQRTRQVLLTNVGPAAELAVAYHQLGDDDSAEAELERAADLIGDRAVLRGARLMLGMARSDDAVVRTLLSEMGSTGDPYAERIESALDLPESAPTILRELQAAFTDDPTARAQLGPWAAYFGEPELAVELMRDDVLEAPLGIQELWSPVMRDSRRTQVFEDLVEDLALVEFWRVRGWPTLCRPLAGDGFECY